MKKKGPKKKRQKCMKICFPTRAAALRAIQKTDIGLLRAYRCGQHPQRAWHTTSKA